MSDQFYRVILASIENSELAGPEARAVRKKSSKVKKICRSVNLAKFLFNLIGFIGISYQAAEIIDGYFNYAVYSQIKIITPEMRLPAITFCMAFWYSELEPVINAHPVGEADDLLPPWKESILDCTIRLPNDTTVSCDKVTIIHRYINSMLECFSLFESNWTLVSDKELTYNQQLLEGPLLKVELTSPYNFSNHWGLSVRSYKNPLSIFRVSESKMWNEPALNDQFWASYSITRRIELPAPYPTKCWNYKKTQWNDLNNAIQNCWIEKLKYNGTYYWPRWAMYDMNLNYSQDYKSRKFASSEVDSKAFGPVSVDCYNKFQATDCQRDFINLTPVKYKRKSKPIKETTIVFHITNVPESIIMSGLVPRMDLIDLINSIGNILSLWIGLAMFMSISSLVSCCTKSSKPKFKCPLKERAVQVNPLYMMNSKRVTFEKLTQVNEKTLHRLSQFFNSSFHLGCLLVTLCLVVDIITLYFENPFYTLILLTIPKTTQLSRLTLCFDLVIDRDKLSSFEQEKFKNASDYELSGKLSIDRLLKDSIDWEKMYVPEKSEYLSSVTSHYEKIHEYFSFTKSITGHYALLHLLWSKGTLQLHVKH